MNFQTKYVYFHFYGQANLHDVHVCRTIIQNLLKSSAI